MLAVKELINPPPSSMVATEIALKLDKNLPSKPGRAGIPVCPVGAAKEALVVDAPAELAGVNILLSMLLILLASPLSSASI